MVYTPDGVAAASDAGAAAGTPIRVHLKVDTGMHRVGCDPSDALDLARAELAEETGLRAGQWTHLGRLVHAQGLSPTQFDVYLAEDLTQGETDREPTESDMVHVRIPDHELDAMIADGRLADAASLAALTLWQRHRAQA
jgi:8-oxo-dGTP pyrophosphatase MutT (NUDIX family)